MAFWKFISGLLDRVFVVAGAFIGSQIPAFIQQYTQRLAGHVAELNHLLDEIRKIAGLSGKTLEQYIQKFLSNSDPDFVLQGGFMQTVFVRWESLSKTLHDLNSSSMWSRPYVFFTELQPEIAKSTFYSFQPSLSLSAEGLVYTSLGLIGGYVVYQGIAGCFRWIFGKAKSTVRSGT